MPPGGSDWAALSVELLSEVFTQHSLETKILCEGICKTWRRTLRDEPVQGLWGNVTLQNLPCPLAIVETDSSVVISQPPSSQHSAALTGWLVQRHKGMNKVVLGCPKKQSGLANYRPPAYGTHQVLSLMAAKELGQSLQLYVFEMDPSVLLDAPCHQVLVKHCGALTLAASPGALAPAHVQALCSLTALTALEFEVTHDVRQRSSDSRLHLPQDLTRLTKLQKMTALSFPALPSDFSRLQHLCNLHLAPSEPVPHDLSTHTLLTRLHIGTCMPMPLVLPKGPNVCLQTLILHTGCQLQNLEDCKKLRDLEIVPESGRRMLRDGAFPTAQLTVENPAELYGEQQEWGRLPDQWQHYTALRKLSIPYLTLEMLPEWITTLSELRILEMQSMSFGVDPYFPSVLRHMPKLQILNMERIDTLIDEEVLNLAQIANLLLLVFGVIGEDPRSSHPLPPLGDDEVLCFQQLAVALESHPNKLMQTRLSASSNQIWTFRSTRGYVKPNSVDPVVYEYMRKIPAS